MTRAATVAACLMVQMACAFTPDAATRFADCVEQAIDEAPRDAATIQVTCDLERPGRYLVVLHPQGELREAELAAAGLTPDLVAEMRVMRIGVQPSIYVISTDPGVTGTGTDRSPLSNRTTSQMHFVQIEKLMALTRTTQPVTIDIGGPQERRVITGVR
jgi:hypothetical protein